MIVVVVVLVMALVMVMVPVPFNELRDREGNGAGRVEMISAKEERRNRTEYDFGMDAGTYVVEVLL